MANFIWDQALIDKYNLTGPRYTSYPTALEFHSNYGEADFEKALAKYPERFISLYVHIPFCHTLCYFCACNKVITRHIDKADIYLDFLEIEIKKRASQVKSRKVNQLHLGGGTPTYLHEHQMRRLMSLLTEHFELTDDCELGIEIDPRRIDLDYMNMLVELGFNRISIGIQDFNQQVQEAVNRVQDKEFIEQLIARARSLGINSINLDLIYGLPYQSVASFKETIEAVIELNPDRLSVFNYAHLPSKIPGQAKIDETTLPSAKVKLELFNHAIERLDQAGMTFIGMDHFAKPSNELAIAQQNHQLHRNFQGYTTHGESDLIGIGVSAISMVGDTYAQNIKTTNEYYEILDKQASAIVKGYSLTAEDCYRRDIIKEIICNFALDYHDLEKVYGAGFATKYAHEISLLEDFVADGIVEFTATGFKITDKGRLFVRHVCMVFDQYSNYKRGFFSRVL